MFLLLPLTANEHHYTVIVLWQTARFCIFELIPIYCCCYIIQV